MAFAGYFKTCILAESRPGREFDRETCCSPSKTRRLQPPESTAFMLGHSYALNVRTPDGSTIRSTLDVPSSREKERPIVVPDQVVTVSKVAEETGLIRVSMFPGILGMDVARDISRGIAELGCSRLIFDLRGNTGGGIGFCE